MTLVDLFSRLKGGPNSGNKGHAGRPGKIGGSAGGKMSALSALENIPGEDINIIPQVDVLDFMGKTKGKRKVQSDSMVPLAELKAQQPIVAKSKVRRFIENFDENLYLERIPIVLKYKNEYVVLDGTHKLSAKKLLGHDTTKVQLIEYFDD